MQVQLPLTTYPHEGRDPLAYRQVIQQSLQEGTPFDCAIVAVPDELHYGIARELLEAGIHTLLVKPFVTRTDHARELIRLVEQQQLVAMVEFHKRWDQSNLVLRDRLMAGDIGHPLYFHVEYSQRKCIPEELFAGWVRETNIFQYLGVHYADMVFFLTGARPRRTLALGQKAWLVKQGLDTFDAVQTLIEWQKDQHRFVSTHLTHWVDPDSTSAMSDQAIKVIGTQGRIECDQKHRGVQVVTDRCGIEDVNPYFSYLFDDPPSGRRFDGYGYQSFRTFLQDVRDVQQGQVTARQLWDQRPSFHSSLVSTAIVQANNMSLQQGGTWVDVDLETDE
jgi:predicted dehydrogenase